MPDQQALGDGRRRLADRQGLPSLGAASPQRTRAALYGAPVRPVSVLAETAMLADTARPRQRAALPQYGRRADVEIMMSPS
jgi:hypothetical protein